ncbi:hypothetical protein ACFRFL_45100, partial [Streptomyces sp. NPDC056708]|uniref:hypothetical protein n=1 Tax=unclassified Streptomyces TaxID=2593676 RepID=UPI0036A46A14
PAAEVSETDDRPCAAGCDEVRILPKIEQKGAVVKAAFRNKPTLNALLEVVFLQFGWEDGDSFGA